MNSSSPYLSIVACARNDDHGGNFLYRLQIFVNAVTAQARRHRIPAELVLVEWNPTPENPPLVESLEWPDDSEFCRIRIITVPGAIHRRYRWNQALPLYQMIAKNAGIRRSSAEFILATNVDVLFSDQLMRFIADRSLERGKLYRVDRYDVPADVPLSASIEEQLDYCSTHRLRINAREGTFALTGDGLRQLSADDIAPPNAGILFGRGWSAVEQRHGEISRWMASELEIHFRASNRSRVLRLELAPSPRNPNVRLAFRDAAGTLIEETRLDTLSSLRIRIASGVTGLSIDVSDLNEIETGTRILQVFRCSWDHGPVRQDRAVEIATYRKPMMSAAWQRARRAMLSALKFRPRVRPPNPGFRLTEDLLPYSSDDSSVVAPELHINASGDFALAHRDHWTELKGYPEFDLYSMNIDAVFCYMAHYGGAREQVLADPMCIYHMEHGGGSGGTAEGDKSLFQRLRAKGIPWLEIEQVREWAARMARARTPLVFNGSDWGLASDELPEVQPRGRGKLSHS